MMGPPQKSPRHARFAKKGSQIRLSTINVGDSLTFKTVKNGSFQIRIAIIDTHCVKSLILVQRFNFEFLAHL